MFAVRLHWLTVALSISLAACQPSSDSETDTGLVEQLKCGDSRNDGVTSCDDLACAEEPPCADADADTVYAWDDCDDDDDALGSSELDGDCDCLLTADDCDDNDPEYGPVSLDNDCDRVLATDDCDDGDPALGPQSLDADCDGVLDTADVCAGYADLDDADADGVPDGCDCDTSSLCGSGASCLEAADGTTCECLEGHDPQLDDPNTCDPVDCGPLDAPDGGSVASDTTLFDETATYSCDPGHNLTGDTGRTCQADATWSGDAPLCEIVDCGILVAPVDGTISVPVTTYGSDATYTCDGGAPLSGDLIRTCQDTGDWSGVEPVCPEVLREWYLVGAATPGGWGWTSATPFPEISAGVFEATFTLSSGSFRIFRHYGNWNSGRNYPYWDNLNYTIDADLVDALDGDNNFSYIGTPGTVTLTLDMNLLTIELN